MKRTILTGVLAMAAGLSSLWAQPAAAPAAQAAPGAPAAPAPPKAKSAAEQKAYNAVVTAIRGNDADAIIKASEELMAKYAGSFTVLGVSLDTNAKDLNGYLAENRLPWPQIYEEGGLDSRPANQLGILTLPTMILLDQDGKVVSRSLRNSADLDRQLEKLLAPKQPGVALDQRN